MVGVVAGGVLAVLDVDRVVGHLLHAAAHEPAVALLGGHALDLGLLRVEVVGDRVHLVGRRTLAELGFGDDGLPLDRVGLAVGVDQARIHVDLHEVGLEVAVLVGDVALVVDVDHLVLHVVDQRVGVLARNGVVEERFGGTGRGRVAARCAGGRSVGRGPERLLRHQRIELRRGDRIAHLLREGVERFAAPCRFAGRADLFAPVAPLPGPRRRGIGEAAFEGSDGGGVGRCHRERVGCGGEDHSPGSRSAGHQLHEHRDDARRKEIFYPRKIQISKKFPYLCRQVGKTARSGAAGRPCAVFGTDKYR